MRANDAKMLLNEAGFACAWSGYLTKRGDAFRSIQPKRLIVTKDGKIRAILPVAKGMLVADVDVQEVVNPGAAK